MRRPSRSLSSFGAALCLAALACSGAGSGGDEMDAAGNAGMTSEKRAADEAMPAAGMARSEADFSASGVAGQVASPAPAPPDAAMSAGAVQGATTPASAMLIRTGVASIEVEDVDRGIAAVRQVATRLGGYVANSSMQGGDDQVRSATLQLKIPAARFDAAVSALAPVGEVESVDVSAQDVGEEFTDLTARVENARRLEERLIVLVATRTGRLEDVLAVERELARVREQIERHDGRLRYLSAHVAVSTLTVTLHEPYPLVGGRPGTNPIGEAFRQAWRNFVHFVAAVIASLGVLVPLALLGALAWWLVQRMRAARPRIAAPAPPPPPPGPLTPLDPGV